MYFFKYSRWLHYSSLFIACFVFHVQADADAVANPDPAFDKWDFSGSFNRNTLKKTEAEVSEGDDLAQAGTAASVIYM